MAAPLPGRCGFFVEKKKRFCKMIVGKGKRFCGEHATMEDGGGSRRIVCPLDPKHTVTEDKLDKHLKKCNSRQRPRPVYFVENINSRAAEGEQAPPQLSLCERSRSELESLVAKLKTAVEGLQFDVDDGVLSHAVLQEQLSDPKNGDSAHKHLRQQSSILGHLEQLGLLGRGRCFVEFGAGRGKLSHWIHEALKADGGQGAEEELQILLVERSSTRFKVDGKHQDGSVRFERLQVDIQHLDLSRVPLRQRGVLPLVGVGKHLCGAATDLALRCLLDTPGLEPEAEPPHKRLRPSEPGQPRPAEGPDPGAGPVLGLVVALCCHHRCEWQHYVGRPFFQQRGLGAAEFHAFCRMSSWATCGLRPTNQDAPSQEPANQRPDDEDHEPVEETDTVNSFRSAAERQQVGRLCKRLIDGGRCHFLSSRGFSSSLRRYVGPEVTLENVLLTAVPVPGPPPKADQSL
ncbi:tRNA:m(4)X modification enzyme TRM13 homolog [Menidia menidia]